MTDEETTADTPTEHGIGGQVTREEAIAGLSKDIADGRRVLYGMCNPEMIAGIRTLPAPYTMYLDDATDELLMVNGGCGCAANMLDIFCMVGLIGVVMVTLPVETSLDGFTKASGYVTEGGEKLQPHHVFVDFGMKQTDGTIAFPLMLKTAIGRVAPELEAQMDEAALPERSAQDMLGLLRGLIGHEG